MSEECLAVVDINQDLCSRCSVCRVTVGGKMLFGCVDGPEFDGHQVDFEELVQRQRLFLPEERVNSLLWEKNIGGCKCGRHKN